MNEIYASEGKTSRRFDSKPDRAHRCGKIEKVLKEVMEAEAKKLEEVFNAGKRAARAKNVCSGERSGERSGDGC